MIDREELLSTLNLVKPALAKEDIIEELTFVWFDGESITASNDLGLGIRVPFKSELKGGLPGKVLIGLLDNSKIKEVELEGVEEDPNDQTIRYKAGRAKATFSLLPLESMKAEPPDLKKAKTFELSKDFIAAVEKVLPCVGHPNANMAEQTGITVIVKKDALYVYSTDGDTIAQATCPYKEAWIIQGSDVKTAKEIRFTMRTDFVLQMLVAGKDAKLEMNVQPERVFVKSKTMLVYAPLVNVEDPTDLYAIVAKEVKNIKYVPIPARLKLALARTFVMLDKAKAQVVDFRVVKGVLRMKTSSNFGELKDSMALDGELPDVETALNPAMIQKGLPLCEQMFVGERSTILTGKDFTYMIGAIS